MNNSIPLTGILAVISLTVACAPFTKEPQSDTMVIVGGYRSSDQATGALVQDTLHRHGIDGIGAVHAGWVDLNVRKSDATRARSILSRLSKSGHPVAVISVVL